MKTYEFAIIISEVVNETEEAIYNKCADSSLGKSNGTTYVAFDRDADSLEQAIDPAIADLKSAGVHPLHVEMKIPATF